MSVRFVFEFVSVLGFVNLEVQIPPLSNSHVCEICIYICQCFLGGVCSPF